MSKMSEMQGVPAHIEILKPKDKRRHPAHCRFHEGNGKNRICHCDNNSNNYLLNCNSAKNCDYYEEIT